MIKVLQISAFLKRNGTETFMMNLFRNIDRSKFHFDFLTFSNDTDGYCDEITELGGTIYRLPTRKSGWLKYHRMLDRFFASHAKLYDVVHFNMSSFTSVAPLAYAKKYGVPVRIFHSHNANCSGLHNKLFHAINKRRLGKLGTHFLACSDNARKWGFGGTDVFNKSMVVTNGIELDTFVFDPNIRAKVRSQMNLSDKFVIGHVGTFNQIKNHRFLIAVFNKILTLKPDAVLMLIGTGSLEYEIKQLIAEFGISDKVLFLGKRNDVSSLLQAMDVFVIPSLHEGLCISAIEAQAASLPVIASTGLPPEANVSDIFHTIELSDGVDVWANHIIKVPIGNRVPFDGSSSINQISISSTVNQLESIYNKSKS